MDPQGPLLGGWQITDMMNKAELTQTFSYYVVLARAHPEPKTTEENKTELNLFMIVTQEDKVQRFSLVQDSGHTPCIQRSGI